MAQIIDRPPIVAGVDLGNANCRLVAWHEADSQPVLLDAGNIPSYPAVVARDREMEGWLVGSSACEAAYRSTVEVFDRLKGNILADGQTRGGCDGQVVVQRLLNKVKFNFQADCASRVVSAVLSVPYSYTMRQRTALRDACSLAGLPVAALINEPEAAILGYGVDRQIEDGTENVLVFDAGASRCTASVVRVSKQGAYLDIELLSEASAVSEQGEPIGGDLIDQRMAGAFLGDGERKGTLKIPAFPAPDSLPIVSDMDAVDYKRWLYQQLDSVLKSARHHLSGQHSYDFEVPWDPTPGRLTRDDLERWCFDVEIAAAIRAAVRGARDRNAPEGFENANIHRVLIVGALNRSSLISRLVDHFLRVEPREEGFEEVAVAAGAARAAAILTGRCDEVVFRPRETPAFGIRTGRDTFDKVIPENAPPGFEARKVYTLPDHYAKQMVIEVCQGFSRRFLPEMSLGSKEIGLRFPEDRPVGSRIEREIHVEMCVVGTVVQVTVTDRTKGMAQPEPVPLEFRVR